MVATIASLAGVLGLLASLVLLLRQNRELHRQTVALYGVSVLTHLRGDIREVEGVFITHPKLRPYFYQGRPCPRRAAQRNRVLTMACLVADLLEVGLRHMRELPIPTDCPMWENYCDFLLGHSPALLTVLTEHQHWWPTLYRRADAQHQFEPSRRRTGPHAEPH